MEKNTIDPTRKLARIPALLPDFGTFSLSLGICFIFINQSLPSDADGLTLSRTAAIVWLLVMAYSGGLAAVLGLLSLLGFGRADGVLRKACGALGLLLGILIAVIPGLTVIVLSTLKERTIAECDQAIARNPTNHLAWWKRGEARVKAGDWDRGIEDLTEALRLRSGIPAAYAARGRAYLGKNQYDPAIADLSEAISRNPRFAAAYLHRGQAWHAKGEFRKAIDDYTEYLRLKPEEAQVFNFRGLSYLTLGERDKASADFTAAIRLNPKFAVAYLNRSSMYLDNRQQNLAATQIPDSSVPALVGWLEQRQKNQAVADRIEAIRLDPELVASTYIRRGHAAEAKGEHSKAIDDFTVALQIKPNDPTLYNYRGRALFAAGQMDRAIADCTEALRLDPRSRVALSNRAYVLLEKKAFDLAIRDYTGVLRADPGNLEAFLRRGIAWQHKGESGKAIGDFAEAIRLSPRNAAIYNLRGVEHSNRGANREAIADYDMALRLDPKTAQVYANRGLAWDSLTQYDRAVRDFNEALRLSPDQASFYNSRGGTFFRMGEYPRAILDFTEAIRRDRHYSVAYCNRGFSRLRQGDFRAAVEDLSEAIRLNPRELAAYCERGAAYIRLGEMTRAADDFTAVVKRAPGEITAWTTLTHLRFQLSGEAGYRTTYAEALKALESTADPSTAGELARLGTLMPGSVSDPQRLVRLAAKAVTANPTSHAALQTLAAALHRAGKFPEAVIRLNEAIRVHGKGGGPADWLFLAMALHQLGQLQEARKWADKANRELEQNVEMPLNPRQAHQTLDWTEDNRLRLLRREAAELLALGKKTGYEK